MTEIKTTCCIAGGGPAGMMLGFLLTRAGVPVVVLEKHRDFLRDFRGDTVHPSTLEIMHELGLLDELLKIPHSTVREISLQIGDDHVVVGHFQHLPARCKFIALMPKWDFLNFIADQARKYPGFDLRMQTEATDLGLDDGRVAGVRAKTLDGIGGQRLAADPPIAAVDLIDSHDGDTAKVFTFHLHHRVGHLFEDLLLRLWREDAFDRVDLNEGHES
jgi:2-polyprenyl-6-methoxyphenol hydroxylase-like FAD-dependent oxidoreductase